MLQDFETVRAESQVGDDLRPEEAIDVSRRRDVIRYFPFRAGEITRRHESVVAAADDDRVVRFCDEKVPEFPLFLSSLPLPVSFVRRNMRETSVFGRSASSAVASGDLR